MTTSCQLITPRYETAAPRRDEGPDSRRSATDRKVQKIVEIFLNGRQALAVVSALNLHALLNAVSVSLRRLMRHEYASLSLYDPQTQRLQIHALDFPIELQPKLLRVLQEQEFERLGSTRTIRVDVRLVAATNSDLGQMVTEKQFRSDLYYRLNVFPVVVSPLRERREDIPLFVRYFAQKYARRMKKGIDTIPAKAMTELSEYHWPGNVRELENLIERSVILSPGPELRVPLGELKPKAQVASNGTTTLEEAEREHILKVLKETHWVIGGPSGAAARLGIKRTTLQARIKKLGITRPN